MSRASNLAGFTTSISPPANLSVGIITASSVINVGTGLTLSSGGINVSGVITATSFSGNGSGLTGVSAGIGTTGSVNTSGIITASSFSGDGSGLTGVAATTLTIGAGTTALPSISPTGDSNTGIFFPSADTIAFAEGGAEALRVDSSGRLLVGTSTGATGTNSQYSLLQVVGHSAGGAQAGLLNLSRNDNSANITTNVLIGEIYFADKQAGEYAKIKVNADGNAGSGDYPGRIELHVTADGASSPTERMRITNEGILKFFSSDTAFLLSTSVAAGTSNALIDAGHSSSGTSGGTRSFIVFTNGNVQNTNNSYTSTSDIKLKENIVDANSQWDDLKALQVRKYNFKDETGHQTHTQIGLVAQEVELVSPGLVSESPDRDEEGNDLGTVTKSVNYSVLYMKAVKALQEAMERIEQLESAVATLQGS